MKRDDFFNQIIDSYLFLDLRNMSELTQKDGDAGGAAGYPMLATCVSGIELLGGLLQGENYNRKNDWVYFQHYWNEYLAKADTKYLPYAKLFWKLVRNGVAHTYMARVGISVTKGDRAKHLVFHSDNNRFNIDCVAFYEDFQKSYQDLVIPKLNTNDAFTRQVDRNIAAMLDQSEVLCKEILDPFRPATQTSSQNMSGSSVTTPSGVTMSTSTTTMIPEDIRQKFLNAQHKSIVSNTALMSGASMMTQEAAESLKKSQQDDFPKLSGL